MDFNGFYWIFMDFHGCSWIFMDFLKTHPFVEPLGGPKKVVGERGLRLSGGERQRLSFARALLRAPETESPWG